MSFFRPQARADKRNTQNTEIRQTGRRWPPPAAGWRPRRVSGTPPGPRSAWGRGRPRGRRGPATRCRRCRRAVPPAPHGYCTHFGIALVSVARGALRLRSKSSLLKMHSDNISCCSLRTRARDKHSLASCLATIILNCFGAETLDPAIS